MLQSTGSHSWTQLKWLSKGFWVGDLPVGPWAEDVAILCLCFHNCRMGIFEIMATSEGLLKNVFIYLTVMGLSCSMWDLVP